MANFFDRHSADADDPGFLAGDPGFPSPARVAWSLYGICLGRPGRPHFGCVEKTR
jgi:hypothetical protein